MSQAIFAQFHDDFVSIARKSIADSVGAIKDLMVYLKANPTLQNELLDVYKQCQQEVGITI